MNNGPLKFILGADEIWQFRRAQSVPEPLAQAVRSVCAGDKGIRACYLLDARKEAGAEVKLVIALSLDAEAIHLERVVSQLQDALNKFPDVAHKTAVMSAKRFESDYAGAEFYKRS